MAFLLNMLSSIIMIVCIMLSVGFFTLLERKTLGYIQYRKGPNKAGIMGLPQPLADAAKLFTKEFVKIFLSNKNFFLISPLFAMIIMMILWTLYNSNFNMEMKWGILFFLSISSLNVYSTLMAGWSSNSKYALLGSVRAVAQTISYEISMAIILICLMVMSKSFSMVKASNSNMMILVLPVIFVLWFISCLAETNRAPFDLAEGESELVSGFNIEYGGSFFAFLFIAEYGSILFMSFITAMMFLMVNMTSTGLTILMTVFISFCFLWVRGTYPRMRYDHLMALTWKVFLSITLSFMMLLFLF